MRKRGASNIDFPLSMAIFLIIIAWFFVSVRTVITPRTDYHPALLNLQDGFESYALAEAESAPVIVVTQASGDYYPVRAPRPGGGNISFSPPYALDDRLYFLANITARKMFYFTEVRSQQEQAYALGLYSDSTKAVSAGLTAWFGEGELSSVEYNSQELVTGSRISVGSVSLPASLEYDSWPVLARYRKGEDGVNITYAVFARNSGVFIYIDQNRKGASTAKITIDTPSFTAYTVKGEEWAVSEGCKSYSGNAIDIIMAYSLLVYSDRGQEIGVCNVNGSYSVTMTLDFTNQSAEVKLIAHSASANDTDNLSKGYSAYIGIADKAPVLDMQKVEELVKLSYDEQRLALGYSPQRNFLVSADSGGEELFQIGKEQGKDANVYIISREYLVQTSQGLQKARVRYVVW